MGHGSSVAQENVQWAVVNAEMQDGCEMLSRNFNFRCSFVEYIKSSAWLDQLTDNLSCQNISRTCEIYSDALSTYQMTMGKMMEVEGVVLSPTLQSFVRSFSSPVTPRSILGEETESYFDVNNCPCFDHDEYLALLFHVMYPAYLDSDEYQRYLKYGIERGASDLDLEDGETVALFSSSVEEMYPCPQSVRLQDILLGCAAHFDESFQLTRLREPEWTDDLTNGLLNHTHAITVMDGAHILYSNKAFQDMTVQSEEDLRHADLSILNGPDTEVSQLLLLEQAMLPMQTAKFAITFYTKNNQSFTDLIAVKTTTGYSVAVHFPAVQGADLEKLKEVDDLLILVSHIVKSTSPRSPEPLELLPETSLPLPAAEAVVLQQAPTEVPPLVPVVLLTAVSEAAEDVKLEVEVEPVDSLQRNIVFVEELPQVVVVGLPLSLSLPLPLINAACLNTESARSGPPSALSA